MNDLRTAAQQAQELDVYSYAALLATAIHAKHYKDAAPQWKPLPDLLGVLTQIDNMTAGLTRLEPVQAEREACAKVCDEIAQRDETGYGIAEDCATAIRARSKE